MKNRIGAVSKNTFTGELKPPTSPLIQMFLSLSLPILLNLYIEDLKSVFRIPSAKGG